MTDSSPSRSLPSQCLCGRFPYPHQRGELCGIGFNEFLGKVQHRLLEAGYNPPAWPEPSIRDQGDVDAALDSCVAWCAARLVEASAPSEIGTPRGEPDWIPALTFLLRHRRHVEQSPGVGKEAQNYALVVLDDLENDLRSLLPKASESSPSATEPSTSTPEGHKQRHVKLHQALDELFADYITHHPEQHQFLKMPLGDFIEWSHEQTIVPTEGE